MTVGKAWTGINLSKKLKTTLTGSKYKDVFNFTTFSTWTKNQLLEPINEMIELLSTSLARLDVSISELQSQIVSTKDPSFRIPLETQRKRLQSQRLTFLSLQDQWKGVGAKLVI